MKMKVVSTADQDVTSNSAEYTVKVFILYLGRERFKSKGLDECVKYFKQGTNNCYSRAEEQKTASKWTQYLEQKL